MKRLLYKIYRYVILSAGLLIIMLQQISAQVKVDTLLNPEQFLYNNFTIARVATKVGKDLNLMANYNIVTEMIVFIQRGQIYDLTDYSNVDTIYFKGHTFIPGGKVFYEVSVSGPVSLLIRHRGTIQSPSKPAAYGGTSEVSSSTYVSYLQMSGGNAYRLKTETSLIIKEEDEYFIGMGEARTPFHNEKQFLSLLPELKSEMKSYIRKNKVHFDNEAEVADMVKYFNSLRK